MVAITLIKQYIDTLVNNLHKISLNEFFIEFHKRFCPEKDISFMEYFLELCDKNEDEFDIPHTKLIEYGVMTSGRSSAVKTKLDSLGLVEHKIISENQGKSELQDILQLKNNGDYIIEKVIKERNQGGTSIQIIYKLNNTSFKLALMRARKYTGQEIDPIIYANYWLLLEQVYKYYCMFQLAYDQKIISMKDDKIDSLINKIDNQSDQLNKQSEQIEMLLNYGKDSNEQIHHLRDEVSILNTKIDNLFDYLLSFARMTIPTWIGSTVIKQQYDTLAYNKDNNYALKHLKVLFMVGFYVKFPKSVMKTKVIDETKSIRFKTRGIIKMYACCTNFADIGPRIKLLYNKYTDGDNVMFMMKPTVITLISCEVNLERIVLENGMNIFPEHSIVEWDSKFKCYNVSIATSKYEKAHYIFDTICTNAGTQRFQGYQQRIDKFNTVSDAKVDENIINYIDKVDEQFFSDTKPFCQQYIDSYYYKSIDSESDTLVEYAYGAPSRKCTKRIDLDNANLNNCGYALRKLETLIEVHSSSDHIKFMADAGILTKENLPTLKAIAKFENIDTSELEEPSDSDEE